MSLPSCAIIPGNGAGDVRYCNWYEWVQETLQATALFSRVELRNMPDPIEAREHIWLPFMEQELGCDENCVLIGHSSGACAALRYAETHKLRGLVLVAAYSSDLGDDLEQASGYFSRPWQWQRIADNVGFCVQFASRDDPLVPYEVQQVVAKGLSCDFRSFKQRGHFQDSQFFELVKVIRQKLECDA